MRNGSSKQRARPTDEYGAAAEVVTKQSTAPASSLSRRPSGVSIRRGVDPVGRSKNRLLFIQHDTARPTPMEPPTIINKRARRREKATTSHGRRRIHYIRKRRGGNRGGGRREDGRQVGHDLDSARHARRAPTKPRWARRAALFALIRNPRLAPTALGDQFAPSPSSSLPPRPRCDTKKTANSASHFTALSGSVVTRV